MWPDRVSNPGPPTYESGALPIHKSGVLGSIPGLATYFFFVDFIQTRLFWIQLLPLWRRNEKILI